MAMVFDFAVDFRGPSQMSVERGDGGRLSYPISDSDQGKGVFMDLVLTRGGGGFS